MSEPPIDIKLMRYLADDLPARTTRKIRALIGRDPVLAAACEAARADLSFADAIREATREGPGVDVERRLERLLTDSVATAVNRDERTPREELP